MPDRLYPPELSDELPPDARVYFKGKVYRPGDYFEYAGDACEVVDFMREAYAQIVAQYPDDKRELGDVDAPGWARLCAIQTGVADALADLRDLLRQHPDNPVPLPSASPTDAVATRDNPDTLAGRRPARTVERGPVPLEAQAQQPPPTPARLLHDPLMPATEGDLADELSNRGLSPQEVNEQVLRARRGDAPPGEAHPFRSDNESDAAAAAADPVKLFTGEFVLEETDISIPGRELDFTFVRRYSSGRPAFGPFGFNWDHNWNVYCRELSDGSVAVWNGRLHEDIYSPQPNGTFEPPPGLYTLLEPDTDVAGVFIGYRLTFRGGLVWRFSRPPGYPHPERIPLTTVEGRSGNRQSCHYDAQGRLSQVRDTVDRPIRFTYGDCDRLEAVHDFSGRVVRYHHTDDTEHLEQVIRPPTPNSSDGETTTYEYDDIAAHPLLRHNIVRVLDPQNRPIIENTYGQDPAEEDFNRVVDQVYLGQEYHYCYERLGYILPAPELVNDAAVRVAVTDPSCPLRLYTFNLRGDLLDERYRLAADGSYRIWATTYRYDEHGNVVDVRRPDGLALRYSWDSTAADPRERANVLQVEIGAPAHRPQPARIVLRMQYEPRFQQVKTVTDEAGETTTYVYDYETDPLGRGDGLLIRIEHPNATLPDGTIQTGHDELTYDAFGLLETWRTPEGRERRLVRGPDGQPTQITQGAGADVHIQRFGYDALGRLTSRISAAGHAVEITYDALDRIVRVRRELVAGRRAEVTYRRSASGTVNQQRTPVGDYQDDVLTDNFLATDFNLDPLAEAWTVTEAANTALPRTWRYERTCTGDGTRAVTDPVGRINRLSHDERGLILQQAMTGAGKASTWSFRYDRNGNLLRTTDPCGRITDYHYDAWGRLVERRLPGIDGARTSVHIEYGPRDQVIRSTVVGVPRPGSPPAVLQTVEQEYDERGRLVRRRQGPTSVRFWYDRDGLLVRVVNERGQSLEVHRDSVGRVDVSTDALGNESRYEFDTDGALRAVEEMESPPGGGAPEVLRRTYDYDPRGRLTLITDPLGNRHRVQYDDRDLPVLVASPGESPLKCGFDAVGGLENAAIALPHGDAIRSSWVRDALGRVTGFVNAMGDRTSYSYGLYDRWETVAYPDGTQRQREFDMAGDVVREETAHGVVSSFHRGADGQLSRVSFSTPADVVPLPDLQIERDGLTRAVRTILGPHVTDLAYDILGRLSAESRDGRAVTWSYNDATSSAELTYPDGRVDRYHFDALGRPTAIVLVQPAQVPLTAAALAPGALIASYAYVGAERVASRVLGNGTTTSYGYDVGARVASVVHRGPDSSVVTEFRYVHDAKGRRRLVRSAPRPGHARLIDFDDPGRVVAVGEGFAVGVPPERASQADQDAFLAGVGTPDTAVRWQYEYDDADFVGRELRIDATGQMDRRWTRDRLGQPVSVQTVGPDGLMSWPYTYDADGHRITDERHRYRYDALGRLREVRDLAGVLVLTLDYDALGRVVQRSTPAGTDRLWYLGPHAVHEEDGAGAATVQRTYGVGIDEVVLHASGANHWFHHDARLSLSAVTNDDGTPIERFTYTPYGLPEILAPDGVTARAVSLFGIRPVFGGHPALGPAGLYDARARCYDAASTRFLQRDPRGHIDSANLHAYCGLDPVDHVDPSGEVLPIIAAFVILGALFGAGYSVFDAWEHPERYSGDFSWRALFQVFGGAAVGAAAGSVEAGVIAVGAGPGGTVGTAAGTGGLTLAQKVFLGGTASSLSGAAWDSGFHSLFPEYADPPTAGSITTDFLFGSVLGPVALQDPGALFVDTIPSSFAPRAFSNNWVLLRNRRSTWSLRNVVHEPRTGREGFKLVSAQYWRPTGAHGKQLHHLWTMQRAPLPRWLEPLRNAGINLLEIGAPLNHWMGGRLSREWGFRTAVASSLALVGYGSYAATSDALWGDDEDAGWRPHIPTTATPDASTTGVAIAEPTAGDQGTTATVQSKPIK